MKKKSLIYILLLIFSLIGIAAFTYGHKNPELYVLREVNISGKNSLYDFNTNQWVTKIDGATGMYYIAMDSERNLYIVDRFENIFKKLDIKLEKLHVHDTDVYNCITDVYISEETNSMIISTQEDFITFIINLTDYSTKLADVSDDWQERL